MTMGTCGSLEALLLALALNWGSTQRTSRSTASTWSARSACEDRDVIVSGNRHRLTLRGRCPYVRVQGTGPRRAGETLGRAPHGRREPAGMGAGASREPSRASRSLARATARSTRPQALAGRRRHHGRALGGDRGAELDQVFDCAGGNARRWRARDNRLTLRDCRELTVAGAETQFVLEGPVRVSGCSATTNSVRWSEGEAGGAARRDARVREPRSRR
jgi:hypothetical protein